MTLPETGEIRINEAYRNYTPPVNASAVVHKLLSSVPSKYLRGLTCVVLTNDSALSRRDRKGKVWSRKRKFDKSRILGFYHGATRRGDSTPWIELRVDKIIEGLNGTPLWLFQPFPNRPIRCALVPSLVSRAGIRLQPCMSETKTAIWHS